MSEPLKQYFVMYRTRAGYVGSWSTHETYDEAVAVARERVTKTTEPHVVATALATVRTGDPIIEEVDVTIGRPAGLKVCDDCGREYPGPAYYTFSPADCRNVDRNVPDDGCTGNLCPRCAGPLLEPDRPDDPRRPSPPRIDSEAFPDDERRDARVADGGASESSFTEETT